MWSTYDAYKDIIRNVWSRHDNWKNANPIELFKQTIKSSITQLKLWSKNEFRGRQKKLEKLVDKLKELKYSDIQYTSGEEIKSVKRQITIF